MLSSATRSTRLIAATIATLAILAGAAGSAQAVAPCPDGFSAGNKLCLKTTHSPDSDNALTDFVSQNSFVTYRVDVVNPGTATATKVVLRFELDRRDPPQPNVRRLTFVTPLPQGCTAPADAPAPNVVTCSLGSVKPTGATPLVFLFNVRTPATAALTSSVARLSADARSSDKGNNPNDPTDEDFEDVPEPVEVRVVDGQSISSVPDGATVTLDTNPIGPAADGSDQRTAVFRLRAIGFSTTAAITDSVPDNTFVCPQGLKCPGGGWTEAFIPGPMGLDDPFSLPSTMQVELRYDASTLPPGFTVGKYAMLHDADYNDPDTGELEQISKLCAPNPKPPCLDGQPFFVDGDFVAKAFVTGNWRFR